MASVAMKSARIPELPRYEFGEPIGSGGMGTVYRALDKETGRAVAIKVLRSKLTESPTQHQRLATEFRAATQLEHPNIVRALEMGTEDSISYLVYELVVGISLGERIEKHGRIGEAEAVRIITQIAQALHYAHLRNVVHRDVKPDNILALPDGRAKLTDFGLAKDYNNDQDLTRHTSALGTPNFMAPEQFGGAKTADVKCDVYSLGATLYNIVTGRLPFYAKTPLATLAKKEKEVPSVRAIVPELSLRIEDAIQAALRPDPTKRPASCLEFFKRLTARSRFDGDAEAVDLPRDNPPGSERRAWVRHPLDVGTCGLIDTSVCGGGPESVEMWPLVVRDVSIGGIGVLLARRFELGTLLTIELPVGSSGSIRRLAARVVRIEPEKAGHWIHGCAFPAKLREDEVTELIKFS